MVLQLLVFGSGRADTVLVRANFVASLNPACSPAAAAAERIAVDDSLNDGISLGYSYSLVCGLVLLVLYLAVSCHYLSRNPSK